jgi:hypothetical protein
MGRVRAANLTSSPTKQMAQRIRGFPDFVGLQRYGLGGTAKSALRPNLRN